MLLVVLKGVLKINTQYHQQQHQYLHHDCIILLTLIPAR